MKFSVFYFSGTGNTKWAVEEFCSSIGKRGQECSLYSIEIKLSENPDTNVQSPDNTALSAIAGSSDLIGFAFPVYGANMPNIMINFINEFKNILADKTEKPAFIITTAGYIDAFGPVAAGKLLKRNGFKLTGYVNVLMSNNISTPKLKAGFQSSEALKLRMDRGKTAIDKLADALVNHKSYVKNIGFYLIPGIVIRNGTKKAQRDNYLALSIDMEKCSRCMACVNNCPAKSIVFSEGKFSFLPSCTSCMRCYNFCPAYAVCHEGKYADPGVYKRYRGP